LWEKNFRGERMKKFETRIDDALEDVYFNNIQVQHGIKDYNELVVELIKSEIREVAQEIQNKIDDKWIHVINKILQERNIDKL
jgi:hypothetical protein